MENLILSPINKDELIEEILEGVKSILSKKESTSPSIKENWTAQETADYCNVSKVTIHEWTKKGLLTKFKIGSRVLYRSADVIASITKIEQ